MPLDQLPRFIYDDGELTGEQRQARYKAEFDARLAEFPGLQPYSRRQKTAHEIEMDRLAELAARADEARDLSPQVWPSR